MVKLQYNKYQFTVSIPREYIEQCKWKKGDTLTVSLDEKGSIKLKKVGK